MSFEPMFLGPRYEELLLAIAAAGFLAGLLWIRRITSFDTPDPAIWRYRDDPDASAWPVDREPVGQGSRPSVAAGAASRLRRRMTIRWLITRLELSIGAAAIAATALLMAVRPRSMGEGFGQPEWIGLLVPLGLAGAIAGLGVMARIAYRDPEDHPSIWRSSED